MGEDEHIIGSQDTEVEAMRFVDGYIAAICNHTGDIDSDEAVQALRKDFTVHRMDDPVKEDE